MRILHFLSTLLLFSVLTLLTQIGGVVLLLNKLLVSRWKWLEAKRIRRLGSFLFMYLFTTLLVVPPLAKKFGKVPMPVFEKAVRPTNFMTCLLNRHYVRPVLRQACEEVASSLRQQYPTAELRYLDANFPFYNGFPLLPHLSHNDGKKLDVSFFYQTEAGEATNAKPSFSGYGVLEKPKRGERDTAKHCRQKGYWQYSYNQWLTLGSSSSFVFDARKTKRLIQLFATHPKIGKVFIEPHLKARLGLNDYSKVRFHGCQAVRHDDHIHVQTR